MIKPAPDWITKGPIAHRALHDLEKGRAENSISAFQASVDQGFAIECDVQLSKGGEPVVFHDPTLDRMTSVSGNVRDFTPEELSKINLLDTNDGIHTLKEHLNLVAGRVPIVVELKGVEGEDAGFVEGVAKALEGYKGQVCVMSFDHWICAQFKSLMPGIPRGLTAHGDASTYDTHVRAMENYDLQFVSYGIKYLPHPFVTEMRKAGVPVISWTVRSKEQQALSDDHADQITFEGFNPR